MNMTSRDELLTTAEVAERCRVNPVTVARWVRTGKLDAVHLPGGTLRFRQSDLDALIASPRGDAA